MAVEGVLLGLGCGLFLVCFYSVQVGSLGGEGVEVGFCFLWYDGWGGGITLCDESQYLGNIID